MLADHKRLVAKATPLVNRANRIAEAISAMHVEVNDVSLVYDGEERSLHNAWNPHTQQWEPEKEYPGIFDLADFEKPLKILQDYSAEPPKARRKAAAEWSLFMLAMGRAPDRLYANVSGFLAEFKDFRGETMTFRLASFRPEE